MNIVERAAQEGVQGFLHPAELEKLMELAAGRDVLEVGAFCGLSAWGMAQTALSVLSVDTFAAATDGQRQTGELTTLDAYKRAIARFDNVDYYVGRSDEHGPSWKERTYDVVFLDATHTYHEVLTDIRNLWPLVRQGGTMALHDYRHNDFPGVEQAADEVFGPAPDGTTVVTLRWVKK